MQNVKLHFWGYTWNSFKWQIAHETGIVLVYQGKLDQEGIVKPQKIVYIFYGRLIDDEPNLVIETILLGLSPNEMLFYSFADVEASIAEDIVNLLINAVSPEYNSKEEIVTNVMIENSGNCELLPPVIIFQ